MFCTLSRYIAIIIILTSCSSAKADSSWIAPFPNEEKIEVNADSILTFEEALGLVGKYNPLFKTVRFNRDALMSTLEQSQIRPNPELSFEVEEVGWDAPGFKESEFTLLLSQEFDPFGHRSSREQVILEELDALDYINKQALFDLYLETKRAYYKLAHKQVQTSLLEKAYGVANNIVENINQRLQQGASLQSELLLAQLETHKVYLEYIASQKETEALETEITSLWNGKPSGMILKVESEPDYNLLTEKLLLLKDNVAFDRDLMSIKSNVEILESKRSLSLKEAKPTLTLSSGIKRVEFDNSHSFLFGISLPLPLFNRNQGEVKQIDANLRSLEYEYEDRQNRSKAKIESEIIKLNQLIEQHSILDSLILPTTENAYETLLKAYESGRVPYTQLLEAERALNDFKFEHNDILLEIEEQIITLESAVGVVLRLDKEN